MFFIIGAVIVGVFFIIFGSYIKATLRNKQKRCTINVKGQVVDIQKQTGEKEDTWHSTIKYYYNGQEYTETTQEAEFDIRYNIGQEINLKCNPNNPKEFYVEEFGCLVKLGNFFQILGPIILAGTIFIYLLFEFFLFNDSPSSVFIIILFIITLLSGVVVNLLIPLAFIGAGILLLKESKKRKSNSFVMTYGRVTDLVRRLERGSESQSYVEYPVIEFRAGEIKLLKEHSAKGYKIGDIVTIYYNPNNPHDYFLEGENNIKFGAYVCIFLGVVIAIMMFFKDGRNIIQLISDFFH